MLSQAKSQLGEIQLCHSGFSSQAHKPFPHHCFSDQTWPSLLFQVSLKYHLLRKLLFNNNKKVYLNTIIFFCSPLFSFILSIIMQSHINFLFACFICELDWTINSIKTKIKSILFTTVYLNPSRVPSNIVGVQEIFIE